MRFLALFLPILGYFVAEQIWGFKGGLCAGILLSFVQPLVDKFQGKKLDRGGILADVGMVLLFSLADYIVDTYAQEASALAMAGATTIIVALFTFLGQKGIVEMMMRVVPDFPVNPFVLSTMHQSFLRMTLWSVFATLIYLFAYIERGTVSAAWIDKYLLITILLAFVSSELIIARYRKRKYRNVEWVLLMDEEGHAIGGCPRPKVHDGSHWLHAVVHLHVFNKKGEILLQLRPKTKKIQPNKWDTAVGGHISYGETLTKALQRETEEEIGLTNFNARLTKKYVWKSSVENEYVFVFETESDGPFNPKNVGEVDELRFWNRNELKNKIGTGELTENLERELNEGLLDRIK